MTASNGTATARNGEWSRREAATAEGLCAILARDISRSLHPESAVPLTARRVTVQLLTSPELRLVVAFRIYTWLWQRFGGSFPYYLYTYLRGRMGNDIALGAVIGPGFRVGHRGAIVIGSAAVIGADVDVYDGVSIGVRKPPHNEMPVIGDRVILFSGAKVLGPIRIGDDARVGANAVVLDDVESGVTVVGIPARPVGRTAEIR
jgi:serine O-acetyltransferase